MNETEPLLIFFSILLGIVITLIIVYVNKNMQNFVQEQQNTQSQKVKKTYQKKTVKKTQSPKKETKSNYLPYHHVNILTKREYNFYKKLKPCADKYDLQILAKIRLADLVEVDETVNQKYKDAYFNKIKSKHIDFAIADNMKIIALLELDDVTHDQPDRIERDKFVDSVVKKCGYTIIHTRDDMKEIENTIKKYKK